MLSAISFGVFWRSAPSTRAIIRSRNVSPGFEVMRIDDVVGQHPGAAGDRRPVAARLTDHRRGLSGDGRLVDRGDAFDDLAVSGDHLACGDQHDVAEGELRRQPVLDRAVVTPDVRDRVGAGGAERGRLGLAAAFGDRLGEVREEDGEPQPDRDKTREDVLGVLDEAKSRKKINVQSTLPISTTNMTGLRTIARGSSLRKLSLIAGPTSARSNSGRSR